MKHLARSYQWINLLSLDVAAGAIVSGLFFAKILQVHLLPRGSITLGLTVWIIYTADHLIDAKRLDATASSDRRQFHQRHFKTLAIVLVLALIVDISLIFFVRMPVVRSGLILGAIVGIYLFIQPKLKSLKELSGTLLYCAGVALPAYSLTDLPLSAYPYGVMIQFAVVVLCNMLLFSLFDLREDLAEGQNSFATAMGAEKTKAVLISLFAVSAVFAGIQFYSSPATGATWVLWAMNLVLTTIFIFRKYVEMNGLYRLLGDAVFLFPVFFLLQ